MIIAAGGVPHERLPRHPPAPALEQVLRPVVGTVLALLPILFAAPDLTREQKLEQWKNFTLAASTLWAGVIVMNGFEDFAAKRDAPAPATPAAQVNVGSDVRNTQAPAIATSSQAPPPGTFTPIITPAPPPKQP
jgi:hypothetical protein